MTQGSIRIRGARQHNLQNLDLDIRTGRSEEHTSELQSL